MTALITNATEHSTASIIQELLVELGNREESLPDILHQALHDGLTARERKLSGVVRRMK